MVGTWAALALLVWVVIAALVSAHGAWRRQEPAELWGSVLLSMIAAYFAFHVGQWLWRG